MFSKLYIYVCGTMPFYGHLYISNQGKQAADQHDLKIKHTA